MRNAMRREFRQHPADTRIILVDPGDRVLRAMPEALSTAAQETLEALGVDMLFKGRVQTMQPGEVTVGTPDGDQRIQAATVIWTAGVRPSHLGKKLADAIGCETDRTGRVIVEPDFSVQGHPEIRVVGDLCSYKHTRTATPCRGWRVPPLRPAASLAKTLPPWCADNRAQRSAGLTSAAWPYSIG